MADDRPPLESFVQRPPLESFVKPQDSTGAMGGASAGAGGFVGGIPIIGPALKTGSQYAAGGIRSLITGQPFSEELGKVREYAKRTEAEHPTAETVGEVGGGIYGMGVAGAAAPAAMGMSGTLPQMMGRGAVSGAGIGAVDALARGQDPTTQGAIGAAGGVAGPLVGKGVSAVAAPVMRTLKGGVDPAGEASRRVAGALKSDAGKGLGASEVAAAKKAGQPAMVMDVGDETTRALARSAANVSPEARSIITKPIEQRFEQQGERLNNWLGTTFHYPNAQAQEAALDKVAKEVNRPAYQRAYEKGSEGMWSPKLEQIASSDSGAAAMQAAIRAAKDEAIVSGYGAMRPNITFTPDGRIQFTKGAKGVPTYPDLQFWDLTRRQLSDAANAAARSGRDSEARRLGTLATDLNKELDRLVPDYKKARQGAAKFFNAENALEAGQAAVTSKMKNREISEGLAKMSPLERQLFQDGYVDRLMQTIRESPDRRDVAGRLLNSEAARERLELAVGPDRAQEFTSFVNIENIMDFARDALKNSTSVRQLFELGLAGSVATGYDKFTGTPIYSPETIINAALTYGAARGHRMVDQRVAVQIAKMLTSQDPQQLQRALTIVASNPGMKSALENADAAITATIIRGSVPAVLRQEPKQQEQPQPQYGGPQQ